MSADHGTFKSQFQLVKLLRVHIKKVRLLCSNWGIYPHVTLDLLLGGPHLPTPLRRRRLWMVPNLERLRFNSIPDNFCKQSFLSSYVLRCGEVCAFLSNIVGNFDIVGNTLWGSQKNSCKKLILTQKCM